MGGTYELFKGDCLELMRDIPDGSVDMILTDPPYGISFKSNYRKEKYEKIENDNELSWLQTYVDEAYRILRKDTALYCFASWHNVDVFKQAFQKKIQA